MKKESIRVLISLDAQGNVTKVQKLPTSSIGWIARPKTKGGGNKIKALRQVLHMTQYEFADALGVARSLISNVESGKRRPPLSLLIKLGNLCLERGNRPEAIFYWTAAGVIPRAFSAQEVAR
jgi:DNA-binding XRE family transcriptional regulator